MDPNKTFAALVDAIHYEDINAAWDAASDLRTWLYAGGSLPDTSVREVLHVLVDLVNLAEVAE